MAPMSDIKSVSSSLDNEMVNEMVNCAIDDMVSCETDNEMVELWDWEEVMIEN